MQFFIDIGNSGIRLTHGVSKTVDQVDPLLHGSGTMRTSHATPAKQLLPIENAVHKRYWRPALLENTSQHDELDDSTPLAGLIDPSDQVGITSFLREFLASLSNSWPASGSSRPRTWYMSSVQKNAEKTLAKSIQDLCPRDVVHLVDYRDVPMKLDVEFPERLGIDRLLASFGAYRFLSEQGPVVTVQAGTAITVDLVDRCGTFSGGSIMPGVGLSLFSLGRGTSLLPWLAEGDLQHACALPGKNTEQAIRAGVQAAALGGVQHLVNRYRSSEGSSNMPVIVSGGDGAWIASQIPPPIHIVDQLVLRALMTIFQPDEAKRSI